MKNHLVTLFLVVTCFEVSGMSCGSCVAKIKDKLDSFPGITRTEVSLSDETMKLHSEKAVDAGKIISTLKELGYKGKSVPCTSSL